MAKKSAIENLLEIASVASTEDCYCQNGWILMRRESGEYVLYNTRANKYDIETITISDQSIWVYNDTDLCIHIHLTTEEFLEFAKKEGISEMVEPVLLKLEIDDE